MTDDTDDDWNEELEESVTSEGVESLVVYSRDWTVDTILRQIEQGNIDLNPGFQRRNAWNDAKRSKLIESLVIGVPVPEIVLAEDLERKKSFIVIDGKQRLLALAGYANPASYGSWTKAALTGLTTRKDLNKATFIDLADRPDEQRELLNADVRCTVISNYKTNAVLYDIFYRLNTGSVPLSSQELRQVLNRGDFADFLIGATNEKLPLHEVLNQRTGQSTSRRRDRFAIHRCLFVRKGHAGNLSQFLDDSMKVINKNWDKYSPQVKSLFTQLNIASTRLIGTFGEKKVGRKYSDGQWEPRFNRALFEVEAYYFAKLTPSIWESVAPEAVVAAFEKFCGNNAPFSLIMRAPAPFRSCLGAPITA